MKSIYNTKSRNIILDLMKKDPNHLFNANEIYECVCSDTDKISRSTVYRQLNKLEKEGLVKKYRLNGDDSSGFMLFSDSTLKRYYFRCEKCGKVIAYQDIQLDNLYEKLRKSHKFEIDTDNTLLNGVCGDCK
ncbi:MAG: transcriptional repressor [Eubacterium sp.]|nr:transcriptional repressor [Eubacterium sp.]